METIDWNYFLLPYEQTVEELMSKFKNIAKQYKQLNIHSPIEEVEGRVKGVKSILDKLNKKNLDISQMEEKIEDIAGIRIVCRFVEDIEKVVNLIKERNNFDLTINEEKDYITNTKSSGYRSYHMLINYPVITCNGPKNIKAEIQIRTITMNFWAKIEHSLRYKYNNHMPEVLQRRLIFAAEAAFKLDKEMSTIHHEILKAQEVIKIRNDIVKNIVDNIEKLKEIAMLVNIDDINKKLTLLNSDGSLEDLIEFDRQIKVMVELYKIKHI